MEHSVPTQDRYYKARQKTRQAVEAFDLMERNRKKEKVIRDKSVISSAERITPYKIAIFQHKCKILSNK